MLCPIILLRCGLQPGQSRNHEGCARGSGTRGPNRRKDFHINPGDEIFYQLEGELNLYYLKDNKCELAVLRPAEIFLLPKNIPHSPRRSAGSWTYVVERTRTPSEMDRFIWPCEKCGDNLYETKVRFDDPGEAVKNATDQLRSDPALATCKKCGQVLEL